MALVPLTWLLFSHSILTFPSPPTPNNKFPHFSAIFSGVAWRLEKLSCDLGVARVQCRPVFLPLWGMSAQILHRPNGAATAVAPTGWSWCEGEGARIDNGTCFQTASAHKSQHWESSQWLVQQLHLASVSKKKINIVITFCIIQEQQ